MRMIGQTVERVTWKSGVSRRYLVLLKR